MGDEADRNMDDGEASLYSGLDDYYDEYGQEAMRFEEFTPEPRPLRRGRTMPIKKAKPGRKPAAKKRTTVVAQFCGDCGTKLDKNECCPRCRREMSAQGKARPVRSLVGEFELVLQSITETFPSDPTTPGISLAWLPNKQEFYGSIVRFRGYNAENRYAVYKAQGANPVMVLQALIDAWLKHVAPPSRNATERLLKIRK